MHQEPAHEFNPVESKFFPYCAISIVLYTERYALFIHAKYPAVTDGYPVSIAPKIMHNALGTGK